ncbi:MAG: hypothetical protein R3324_09545 [Halobacteriales archaeon]|nr:hypothetical protein [Halobacteriales archaeon]
MSAEDRRERRESERRELRKLAFEDADRTFADPDRESLTPKLPLDPPKLQFKDTVGDPQPKSIVLDPPKQLLDPKQPIFDPKQPWIDPKYPWMDPKQPWFDPKQPWFDPKQPWQDPEPKSVISDKGGFDPPGDFRAPKTLAKDLIGDPQPQPKSIVSEKGGFDPKQTFDPPKHLIDPPKRPWFDPEPKRIIGDPKSPKNDLDPDPKNIVDPKNFYDPPKVAYDPGPVFDPGRVFDPGAVARRPFVLGMPHHAPSAGTMAGADPRAATMQPAGAGGEGGLDSVAYLESMLAQVEASMRTLKDDLEKLDDYYRTLRERLEEVEKTEEEAGAEEEGEDEGQG